MSSAKADSAMDERVSKPSCRIHDNLPVGRAPPHFNGLWEVKIAVGLDMRHMTLPNLALGSDIQH